MELKNGFFGIPVIQDRKKGMLQHTTIKKRKNAIKVFPNVYRFDECCERIKF